MIGELTTHLMQSTVFAVAAGLLTLAFRRNRAGVRYWIWLSASLKFFVPFALLVGLGSFVERLVPETGKIATPVVAFAVEYIARSGNAAVPVQTPPKTDWAPMALSGLWACGFLAILTIRFRGARRVRAAVRAGRRLDIPADVEIRSTPGLLEPGVVGLLRPVLLLPDGIEERLEPIQLEAVIAHELCHVRRRDNLFAAIHMITEALFWFHPLVWWIGARLVAERERACDEEVLSLGSQPRVYADAILSVCRLYVESPLACVAGVTGAGIKERIEAIMTNRRLQGLTGTKKMLLAGAGVVALAMPVTVGVFIGIGHLPVVQAQAPPPAAPAHPLQMDQSIVPTPGAPKVQATQTVPEVPYSDRRLVVMLFDLDSMTADEQARARQGAINFVHNSMQPNDVVSVIAVSDAQPSVLQDFTPDAAVLEAAVQTVSGGNGSGSGWNSAERVNSIAAVSRMLAHFPEKKNLMYYSTALSQMGATDGASLVEAINAAKKSNVAIFPIDVGGTAPASPPAAPTGGGGRGAAMSVPPGVSQEEYDRRVAYAQTNFGSVKSATGRTYVKYGPPDQIEDRKSGAQSSQIWRYRYLESFHSSVEFELTPGPGVFGVRINYPPPLTTSEGVPDNVPALAQAINQEGRGRGASVAANAISGFPGRHASFEAYPAGEFSVLSVPLDSLSGQIDIVGQIKWASGSVAGVVRDNAPASTGVYRTNFTLATGSYVCSVLVREQATGRMFGETINFDVK
jgi:beta-lactamase regulating signal transducer with metallopeptidase domain